MFFKTNLRSLRGMNLQMSHCFRLFIWYVCRAISSVENILSLFNDSSRNRVHFHIQTIKVKYYEYLLHPINLWFTKSACFSCSFMNTALNELGILKLPPK